MMQNEIILPCPFDGGDGYCYDWEIGRTAYFAVCCKSCGSKGKEIKIHIYYNCEGASERDWAISDAVYAWNKRVCT